MIHEVRFDANVPGEHVGDEAIGEFVFGVENANHLLLVDDENSGRHGGGSSTNANRLGGKTTFTEKIARSKNRDNGFFTDTIYHGELHRTFLDVHDGVGYVTLG